MQQQDTIQISGSLKITKKDNSGNVLEVLEYKNLNPSVFKNAIAKIIADSSALPASTDSILLNYVALGSGTNSPSNSDTTLQTESYRNLIASISRSNSIIYITAFFQETETSGTYREAGLFANGTASADTGILASRVAINVTKSTSETLTIEWTITIN